MSGNNSYIEVNGVKVKTDAGAEIVNDRDVQPATKNGFRTVKGKTYYYKNGKKVKGWLTLNGKKYYFSKSTGVQAKGWVKDKKGRKRYFTSKAGVMVTFQFQGTAPLLCTVNRIHEDKVAEAWRKDLLPLR